MAKRLLALILVLASLISAVPVQAFAAGPYADVDRTHWFYEAVSYVTEEGLMEGISDTDFAPYGSMTRASYVTILGKVAAIDPNDYDPATLDFTDVPKDADYAPYVVWALSLGITAGMGNGKFGPDVVVTRQQLAVFTVRFYENFGDELPEVKVDTLPKDLDKVAVWAVDEVKQMWSWGMFSGDDKGLFNPEQDTWRCEAAAFFHTMDKYLYDIGYKEKEKPVIIPYCSVLFYDGDRLVERMQVRIGKAPEREPSVEDTSKAGYTFVGWFLDEEFTKPFYAETKVYGTQRVYGKYEELPKTPEALTIDSFTRMDMQPGDTIEFDGAVSANDVTLTVKDGTEMPALNYSGNQITGDFRPGSSYELEIQTDELNFSGMPASVRKLSFSIQRDVVTNLSLNKDIQYIQDTEAITYSGVDSDGDGAYDNTVDVLTGEMGIRASGSTVSSVGTEVKTGIVCFYQTVSPEVRDYRNESYPNDPEVYVKVTAVSGGTLTIVPLGEDDLDSLYAIPDVFPILLSAAAEPEDTPIAQTADDEDAPTGESKEAEIPVMPEEPDPNQVNLKNLDLEIYSLIAEQEFTVLNDSIRSSVDVGDYVVIYADVAAVERGEETPVYGKITSYDKATGTIGYEICAESDIISAGDVYVTPQLDMSQCWDEETKTEIQDTIQDQVEESGFAEEAAQMLAQAAVTTDGFQQLEAILLSDEAVPMSGSSESYAFSMVGKPQVKVSVNGEDKRYNGSLSIHVAVKATFAVPVEEGKVYIDLEASFEEEVYVKPSVSGQLTYTKILFIPVPNGVHLTANLDVKNYTGFDFDVIAWTECGGEFGTISDVIDIGKELTEMIRSNGAEAGEDSDRVITSVDDLMDRYSQLIQKETDWVTLVEQEIAQVNVNIYAISIFMKVDFVVRANMSIAMGSQLSYEVGKRYTFWFEVGLYKPRGGSSTMDLLDESLDFRFYVLGKLDVKMGVRLTIGVALGSADLVSVGLYGELGPYLKLKGVFYYDYSLSRSKGSQVPQVSSLMMGGLNMEAGLYLIVGVEASAVGGLFEASYDFCNEEYPIMTAGIEKFPYKFSHDPDTDEKFYITGTPEEADFDKDGKAQALLYTCTLPDSYRALTRMDLTTGIRDSMSYDYSNYNVRVTNENFTAEIEDGQCIVTAKVPNGTRMMKGELVMTYKGKQAFSVTDIQVRIPMVWSNLSDEELKNPYTVSVEVCGEAVWSQRVIKGEEFQLPTADEIRKLAGLDNNWKYAFSTGYAFTDEQTNEGNIIFDNEKNVYVVKTGVIRDTVYEFDAQLRSYTLNLSTSVLNGPRSFTALYGQSFDFSALENNRDAYDSSLSRPYVRYSHVEGTAQMTVGKDSDGNDITETINLYQPISQRMAQILSDSANTGRAVYVDDTVIASFQVVGEEFFTNDRNEAPIPDMSETGYADLLKNQPIRKGGVIDIEPVKEAAAWNGKILYGVSPHPNTPMMSDTEYTLKMGSVFDGVKNTVSFDLNAYSPNDDGIIPTEPTEPTEPSDSEGSPEAQAAGKVGNTSEDPTTESTTEATTEATTEPTTEATTAPTAPAFLPDDSAATEQKTITDFVSAWIQPLKKASRVGYDFLDWSLTKLDPFAADAAESAWSGYKCGDLMQKNKDAVADVTAGELEPYTLYAMWQPHTYQLVYDLNDGGAYSSTSWTVPDNYPTEAVFGAMFSNVPDLERSESGNAYPGVSSTFSANHGFIGWFTVDSDNVASYRKNEKTGVWEALDKDGKVLGYEVSDKVRVKIFQEANQTADNKKIVLYAHWRDLVSIPTTVFTFNVKSGTLRYDASSTETGKHTDYITPVFHADKLPTVNHRMDDFTAAQGSQFAAGYKLDEPGGDYVDWVRDAGSYIAQITRKADDYYKASTLDYQANETGLVIQKMQKSKWVLPDDIISVSIGLMNATPSVKYSGLSRVLDVKSEDFVFVFTSSEWDNLTPGTLYNDRGVIIGDQNHENKYLSVPFTTKSIPTTKWSSYTQEVTPNSDGVYEISSAKELAWVAQQVNAGNSFKDKTVKLTADIDLSEHLWVPIGNWDGRGQYLVTYDDARSGYPDERSLTAFKGTFNGNGKTISYMVVDDNISAGLFGATWEASVTNVTIRSAYVIGDRAAGVAVGIAAGGNITNVTLSGTVIGPSDTTHAVCGTYGYKISYTVENNASVNFYERGEIRPTISGNSDSNVKVNPSN